MNAPFLRDGNPAATALQECEERFRVLVDYAPEAVLILDVDAGHFVDANPKANELFGLTREALLRSDPVSLSPPLQPSGQSSRAVASQRLAEALEGKTPTFDWMHRTDGGVEVACEVRLVRLPAADRRLVRGSVSDVTRLRQLEERLRQWQRVEAVGQFASGFAHEFNNVLTVMAPSVDRLVEDLAGNPPLLLEVGWIRSAVDRGSALTQRLLEFSRPHAPTYTESNLDEVIRDSTGLLARLLSNGVLLITHLDADGAVVACDRYEVEQVLINLVLNARDAMPNGGSVTMQTSRIPDRTSLEAPIGEPTGPLVRLRVEDTGVGMDEATRRRVFDAFFTTKQEGRGTGLGLSITNEIVQRAGG